MPDKELFSGWKGYWNCVNGTLNNNNQYTLAFGFAEKVKEFPFLAIKQGGKVPLGHDKELEVVGMFPPPGWNSLGSPVIRDGRDFAFKNGCGWKRGEATGIHAEVLLIRAWMNCTGGATKKQQFEMLTKVSSSIYISASQPACWCCAALMKSMGIHYDSWTPGSKPLTGWRHPLSNKTVPNSDIPVHQSSVNNTFLSFAAGFQ